MFENVTFEDIMQRMLDGIDDKYDKREGSIIYIALAPAAIELQNAYIELDGVLQEVYADTASREYLIKRASEKGIKPTKATNSIVKGEFNIAANIGARFTCDSLSYVVTELIDDLEHTYKLKCETTGTIANGISGNLIPIDYIKGLTKAILTEIIIPGEDDEETEKFRERYFSNLNKEIFSGNAADYETKIEKLDGVGGIKVIPNWEGGGTVKVVIIDSQYKKPSDIFISELKEIIDPVEYEGLGVGLAPIGHVVTVESVKDTTANISVDITYRVGVTFTDLKENIENIIEAYLLELRKTWKDEEYLVVRISQIESRILTIEGIIDVSNTRINDVSSNLILDKYSIPIRGEVLG